jgi:hypothetical protein
MRLLLVQDTPLKRPWSTSIVYREPALHDANLSATDPSNARADSDRLLYRGSPD